jgi:hypothetical protein
MARRKDSPELFEVFKTKLSDGALKPPPAATPAAEPRQDAAAEASELPADQRIIALNLNTAVLLLLLFFAALVVAFALGVKWGEEKARREALTIASPSAGDVIKAQAPPVTVRSEHRASTAPVEKSPTSPPSAVPTRRPASSTTTGPTSSPKRPAMAPYYQQAYDSSKRRFYTIQLIYYRRDAEGRSNARRMVQRLKKEHQVEAFQRDFSLGGERYLGVCTGQYPLTQEGRKKAYQDLSYLRKLMRSFAGAEVISVSR